MQAELCLNTALAVDYLIKISVSLGVGLSKSQYRSRSRLLDQSLQCLKRQLTCLNTALAVDYLIDEAAKAAIKYFVSIPLSQ